MAFIEIEKREIQSKFNMSNFQSHDFFELYFLLSGSREIFIQNKLFVLNKNSLCVIPPYSIHKTEGDAYIRYNLYISQEFLTEAELNFLNKLAHNVAFKLSSEQMSFISLLFEKATEQHITDATLQTNHFVTFAKTALAYLSVQPNLSPLSPAGTTASYSYFNTTIMQIVSYINENYQNQISLNSLSKKFFISKITLCKRFRQAMNCSVVQYLTYVRLNKAKQYLFTTNKDMETIAEICGFSSGNYFSLIFKKHFGISPQNYRKKQ